MLLISKGCFGAPPDAHLFASESFLSEVASSFVFRRSINGEQGESVIRRLTVNQYSVPKAKSTVSLSRTQAASLLTF
jgi:hypothetical protein